MANRLTQLLSSGTRRRQQGQRRPAAPGPVTVLDLDGITLRIAQANGRSALKLVATASLDFPADVDRTDPAVVGAAVARALARLDLKPGAVVMGLGRSRVVLRNLKLPSVENLPELASLVQFQVAKDLPFPAEDAVIDFQVVREIPVAANSPTPTAAADSAPAPAPRLDVLVAAVKREVVDYYRRLAVAAGFNLTALSLLPYGNSRGLEACAAPDGQTVLALVSLRPDEVGVDVVAHHSLVFSRGTLMRPIGEKPPGEGTVPITTEAFVQAAVIEAVRSLHGYGGTEPGLPVGRVLVVGATGCETAVLTALRSRLPAPCGPLKPGEALQLPAEWHAAAAGSLGAVGLALGFGDEQGLPFNFLDPKKPAVPRNLKRIRLLTGAVTALVVLFALLGVRKVLVDRRTVLLEAANAELADAEKKRPIYRTLMNHAAVVGDWVKGGRDWLQHYAYLAAVLPASEEVYLTSLAVDNQGVIRLSVQARSGEILARLDKQLRAAGYEVKPLAINPGANRFGYGFRSNVELIPSPKLKIDLAKKQPAPRPADDVSLDPQAWKRGAK